MATALTVKTRSEQVGNHTVSSAVPHESTCPRCDGLMVDDLCMDLLNSFGESKFVAKRCVQCGEVVDPVILSNRQLRQEPMAAQLAGRMLPNNCVMEGR